MKIIHFKIYIRKSHMYPFHPCSTIGVSGCTGSEKTTWVLKFLSQKNDLFFENSPNMV